MGEVIKNLIVGAITLLLTAVGLTPSSESAQYQPYEIKETEPKSAIEQMDELDLGKASYRYTYEKLDTSQKLKLLPNYVDKRAAQNLKDMKQCQFLVNGGFYSEEFEPLGWLVVEGSQLSAPIESQLLDGFFSIDQAEKPEISWQKPEQSVRMGLQSGPMLIWQGSPLVLQIKADQPRRRIVLGLTKNQEIVFIVITGDKSVSGGPYLADLPTIVAAIDKKVRLNLQTALNLDGGSASAFLSPEVALNEVSFIGSYFCLH